MGRKLKANPFRFLVRDRASGGALRLYYREPLKPRVRINVPEDHSDFAEHFAAAKAGNPLPAPAAKEAKAVKPREGTLTALVHAYSKSAAFLSNVRPEGRKAVLAILESCCAEIWPANKTAVGLIPCERIGPKHVQFLMDQKATFPGAANNRVKYLRILFNWAKIRPNPANDVEYVAPKKKDGHHSWTLKEIAQFEAQHPVGTTPRLALDLALYTAARRADIVKLGPKSVGIGDGLAWLSFVQGKTGGSVEMPVLEPLALSIAAARTGDKTFLVTGRGHPFAVAGFGNAFRDWCDQAGLPQCSIHGLRKASGSKLAEIGCSEDEIRSILGHAAGSKETGIYTRAASRRRMAESAMRKLQESLQAKPKVLMIEGPRKD